MKKIENYLDDIVKAKTVNDLKKILTDYEAEYSTETGRAQYLETEISKLRIQIKEYAEELDWLVKNQPNGDIVRQSIKLAIGEKIISGE